MSRSKLNELKAMYSFGLITDDQFNFLSKKIFQTAIEIENKGKEMTRKRKDDADLEFRKNLLKTIIVDDCKAHYVVSTNSYAIVTRLQIPCELINSGKIDTTMRHLEKLRDQFVSQIDATIQDIKDRNDNY